MSKITCSYLGDLKCEAKHLQSGNLITTDAPIDPVSYTHLTLPTKA